MLTQVKWALARPILPLLKEREDRLEASGRWADAQKLRKHQHKILGMSEDKWQAFHEYLQSTYRLRLVAQRRMALEKRQWQITRGESTDAEKDPAELEEIRRKLEALNMEHHSSMRWCWDTDLRQWDGPFVRALRATASITIPWDTPFLVWECKMKRGCCLRNCGCCKMPRIFHRGAPGHCTPACACCEKDRGFPIPFTADMNEPYLLPFNMKTRSETSYSGQMMNARVWGIGPSKEKGPVQIKK
ncbi:uncharacterized protein LDX57_011333 [Aspergillus melleus]|uniref:uncharacterized protein n=1 Tax=Aspergillus melleus TaxID=138277 RepID=UPI001E8E55B5|nr:uncharacterized protein LDX57_011333 [Aspergillus melleus]KAH8433699.1 hypothetical protein LDX57_011333 [Aspergillus melleus]